MPAPVIAVPSQPPYTVDDLFTTPDDGNRCEVFGGSLVVSPAPAPIHQLVADELRLVFRTVLAVHPGIRAVTAVALRMPNGDGLIPDVTVTGANLHEISSAIPAADVFTVVEVVSRPNAVADRRLKPKLYAAAGIPCYWRVEPNRQNGNGGRRPLIVIHLRTGRGWRSLFAPAGTVAELPVAVGPGEVVSVKLDPAELVAP